MKQQNNLIGLDRSGFQNSDKEFNSDIFKNNDTIDLLRPVIRKYFTKSKTIYRGRSSYGIKHVAERHLGSYVSNGELIYAMHLEGYKISRDGINCYFNVSKSDIRILENAKSILETLTLPLNSDIYDYLNYKNKFLKFKYHIKFLIEYKSWNRPNLKRDVLKVISKEINEPLSEVTYWTNMLESEETTIPMGKIDMLETLFNLPPNKLVNIQEKLTI